MYTPDKAKLLVDEGPSEIELDSMRRLAQITKNKRKDNEIQLLEDCNKELRAELDRLQLKGTQREEEIRQLRGWSRKMGRMQKTLNACMSERDEIREECEDLREELRESRTLKEELVSVFSSVLELQRQYDESEASCRDGS